MKHALTIVFVVAFLSFPITGSAGPLHDMAEEGNLEAVKNLLSQGVNADTKDDEGWTALHHAAFVGYVDIVKLLLEKKATVDVKDKTGKAMRDEETDNLKFEGKAFENALFPDSKTVTKDQMAENRRVNATLYRQKTKAEF